MTTKQIKKIIIAAFDFDCTITTKDTLLPFLIQLHSCPKNFLYSLKLLPIFLGYKSGLIHNQTAKEKLLSIFLKNIPYSVLEKSAQIYAQEKIPAVINAQALKRIRWHQAQQHKCVLISAGLEIYLEPWAKKIGFDHVLATQLRLYKNTIINGKNCFGIEKVNRLKALMGDNSRENYIIYAYGDSRGDKELLSFADHPFYRRIPHE